MLHPDRGVKRLVLTLLLAALGTSTACHDSRTGGRDAKAAFIDPDAPTVSATTPAAGATEVAIDGKLNATFSTDMDPDSISLNTFLFTAPGMVSYNQASRIATFTPSTDLAPNTSFTATITTGAQDLTGKPLAAAHVWTFTTGATADTTAPSVTTTTPASTATDVPTNGKLTATFSEAMLASTLDAATFLVTDDALNAVAGVVTYADAGRTATFAPTSALDANTPFIATVTTGAEDLAGNGLATDHVWTFSTGDTIDVTSPTVTLVNPADLAARVFINKRLRATFSERMDPATITSASYRLTGPNQAVILGTVAYDALTRIATFASTSDLAPTTQYTATLTIAIADLAENGLDAPFTWRFTTGTARSPAPVDLRSAAAFAVLAGSTVTNVDEVGTIVTGDLGVSAGTAVTGFPAGVVNGTIHAGDNTAAIAQGDLTTAYNDAAGRTIAPILKAGNLGGQTLAPGLYKSNGSLEISSGDLTLDAQGDSTGVFIFQIASTLTTTPGRKVFLIGGAVASNVFWQVGTSATLDTTTVFAGTIMADQAITLNGGASLEGRALARIAGVSMDDNAVTKP